MPSHETVRFWWNRFGPVFAAELRNTQRKIARQHVRNGMLSPVEFERQEK